MRRMIFVCPEPGCEHWADARHVMCLDHHKYGRPTVVQPQEFGDALAIAVTRYINRSNENPYSLRSLSEALDHYKKETR
jgi:hypothetical protein